MQSIEPDKAKRGLSFWAVILGINISSFLALLEGTIISNALPTIINDLHGTDYVWIGAAYNLAAAAFMPSTGILSQVIGRKPVMVGSLLMFSAGCAICGASQNMTMLIAGRSVQGIGGAGILSTSAIILSDIVPLSERGAFNGLLQLTWCLAGGTGPIVGGSLALKNRWRWIFYLNLPIAPLAAGLIVFFLHLKIPKRSFKESVQQMDWIGNIVTTGSSCAFGIGLVWGGVTFPWSSAQVLVPLIVGAIGLLFAVVYEWFWSAHPMLPIKLITNRTILSGYLQTLLYPIPFLALVYYFPLYFQACKGVSPLRSGVLLFGISFSTPPLAIFAGLFVTVVKRYRGILWLGWVISIVGLALLGTIHADTSTSVVIGYEILTGAGFGIVFSATYFPVLAPLPVTSVAKALAFYAFIRQFSQIWGVVIGGIILQTQLAKNIPPSLANELLQGGGQAINIVPQLVNLPPDQQSVVRAAFAQSLGRVWQIMAGLTGLGLLISLLVRHHALHTSVDKDWGLKGDRGEQEPTKAED